MILADINILLPGLRPELTDHEPVRAWLEEQLASHEPIVLTGATICGLSRIATNRNVFDDPAPIEVVSGYIDDLFESGAGFIGAGPRHWDLMRGVLDKSKATGDLVSDAHLAAVALEHGARIATRDRDFARFPGVDWFDPLD